MNYNPYANPYGMQQKSPQQMQEEYQALMAQYTNMFNQQQPQQNKQQNPAVSEKGQFVKVANFEEVSEYPTSLDGTATLFFDFKNKVFWSKKFLNGGHSIQAFTFQPVNSTENTKSKDDEEIDYTKELENIKDPTTERLDKLEKMIESLASKKTPVGRPKKEKEDIKDEI